MFGHLALFFNRKIRWVFLSWKHFLDEFKEFFDSSKYFLKFTG
jgi:hypothetical protein